MKLASLSDPKSTKFIIVFLLIIPILFYLLIVDTYAINVPFQDDYDTILKFLTRFSSEGDWWNRFKLLVETHNEHRILFPRLVTLIQYSVSGKIDFKILTYLGNILLLIVCFILYKVHCQDLKFRRLLFFLPVPLILFQFQYYDDSLMATGSLQNFGVILFSLTSMWFLNHQSKKHFAAAIFFAVLATYTSGNGLLTFFCGFSLLVQTKRGRNDIIAWVLLGVISIGLYFLDYKGNPEHPRLSSTLSHPVQLVHYGLNFTGAYFGRALALPCGILMSAFLIHLFRTRFYKQSPLLFNVLLFFFLSAALVSLTRSEFGAGHALSTRYRIKSAMLIVLFYFVLLVLLKVPSIVRRTFIAACIIALLVNLNSFFVNRGRMEQHHDKLAGTQVSPVYPNTDVAFELLKDAKTKGIYVLPR